MNQNDKGQWSWTRYLYHQYHQYQSRRPPKLLPKTRLKHKCNISVLNKTWIRKSLPGEKDGFDQVICPWQQDHLSDQGVEGVVWRFFSEGFPFGAKAWTLKMVRALQSVQKIRILPCPPCPSFRILRVLQLVSWIWEEYESPIHNPIQIQNLDELTGWHGHSSLGSSSVSAVGGLSFQQSTKRHGHRNSEAAHSPSQRS